MEALKGRQGEQKLPQSHTCRSGEGSLGTVMAVVLPAWPACCNGPWLFMVPAHVERIRARKDMFSLPSWKEDQGDLVTAQRFWACGQPRFSSRPSPRTPGSAHHLLAALSLLEPPASLEKQPWLGLPFYSWNPCL